MLDTRIDAEHRGVEFVLHRMIWKPVRYAAAGGPNQVVSASASPG
jgi:hypothetical protein